MKIKIILSIILLVLFGIFFMNLDQFQSTTEAQSQKVETYKVIPQDDLILKGEVKAKKIQTLDTTDMKNLLVNNGDHVTKGQEIYNTGYVAPLDGTFSISEDDNTFAIISDEEYVSASISEIDKNLIHQGDTITVKSLDNSQSYQSQVTRIGISPVSDDNLSDYLVESAITGLPNGQHVYLYISYSDVVIPQKYVKSGTLNMKKPGANSWMQEKISLTNKGGVFYAHQEDVPIGTLLRKPK